MKVQRAWKRASGGRKVPLPQVEKASGAVFQSPFSFCPYNHSARNHTVEEEPMEKDFAKNRGVTLNSLLEEQRALNMRLLLAVQIRDLETQTSLRQELEENAAQIDRLLTGRM